MRISSPANEKIKLVTQLQSKASARRKQKMFVVEGIRMYEEIPASELVATYVSEEYYDKTIKAGKLSEEAKANLSVRDYYIVADSVFKNMSDTVTPQGILAVLERPAYTLEALLQKENPLFVVLEDIQDPGNLGTIV